MYKLIASDMDGTLLSSERTISERTIKAIRELKAKGVKFVLCTGRALPAIKKYQDILKIMEPVILCNGAEAFDVANNKVIFQKTIDFESAKCIWEEGVKRNTEIYFWAGNELYTNFLNDKIYDYTDDHHTEFKKLTDFDTVKDKKFLKFIWDDTPENISRYKKEMDEMGLCDKVNYCTSMAVYLEFFNKETDKGAAIKELQKFYNIKREEVIAIGDGNNDIEMIKYAGLGVAMGNAADSIKNIADYVTSTNDEDGVYEVINKFVM